MYSDQALKESVIETLHLGIKNSMGKRKINPDQKLLAAITKEDVEVFLKNFIKHAMAADVFFFQVKFLYQALFRMGNVYIAI